MTVWVRKNKQWGFTEYHIRGKYPNGEPYEERKKSHLTGMAATKRWAEERERIMLEQWHVYRREGFTAPTLGELWDKYMEHSRAKRNAEGTLEWKTVLYQTHIEPMLGAKTRIDKITADDITKLKHAMRGAKEKSVNNVLGVLGGMLRWAQKKGQLALLPDLEPLKVPESVPKFLPTDAYEKLLDAARELDREDQWQPLAVVLLGADAGLRRGEILALQWKCLDFDGGRIRVEHSYYRKTIVTTKGKRFRVVGMSDELARVLKSNRHLRGPFVFYGERGGRPASPRVLYRWFEMACDRAKITTEGKAHVLRHTFGEHLAEAGVDLHRIQYLLGHSDQRTTEIYARIAAGAALEATDKLGTFRADRRRAKGEKPKGSGQTQ